MDERVTVKFSTSNDNLYLFDDSTSLILNWSVLRERILLLLESKTTQEIIELLSNEYSKDILDEEVNYINDMKTNDHAFYRSKTSIDNIETTNLRNYIENFVTQQMTLCVTSQCNLRCKYCIYSDNYDNTTTWNNQFMTKETAIKAVKYFYSIVERRIKINPSKIFSIGFYGGEPLLNFEVIKATIDYINNTELFYSFNYTITTNAILLTESIIDILADNNVLLLISLDGPEDEHDRLRVDQEGRGSFKYIISKINIIKEKYPIYFKTRVGFISVYDTCSDIIKIEEFFSTGQNESLLPLNFMVNGVNNSFTDYYNKFTNNQKIEFSNSVDKLIDKFVNQVTLNQTSSRYLELLIGANLKLIHIRKRMLDVNDKYIPISGACIPGQKLYVNCNGEIQICEKVSGKSPIGSVYKGGINEYKIKSILNSYRSQILSKCYNCPITKLCQLCYTQFEDNGKFVTGELRDSICNSHKLNIVNNLKIYTEIFEENPNPIFFEDEETGNSVI